MKQIKRIIALLLCPVMVLAVMPLTAFADTNERPMDPALIDDEDKITDFDYDYELNCDLEGDYKGIHYEWNHTTKTLFVDGIEPDSTMEDLWFEFWKFYTYTESERELEIADGNYDLGFWAELDFQCAYMEHLVIGSNITKMEGLSFEYIYPLREITTVENHPGLKMVNCGGFSDQVVIDIPNGEISLSQKAYAHLEYDTLVLPSTVTELSRECFYESKIRIIDLSQTNITTIPTRCFYGVKNLETVMLPPSVEKIESEAFYKSDIQYITLPSAVVSLGSGAFRECARLESADLSRTNIKNMSGVFYGCTSLTDVQLPPEVEYVQSCFGSCTSLEHLEIPDSVIKLSGFKGVTKIHSINLPHGLQYLDIEDLGIENLDLSYCVNGLSIGNCYENLTLKTVVFPRENFDEVGANSFECCYNLESVTLYCCNSIGHRAFAETKLTEVEIPDNCTLISFNAFQDCANLRAVRMPMDLECIDGGDPFDGCANLETVIYPSRNKLLYSDRSSNDRLNYERRASYLHRDGFLSNENVTVYLYPDTEIEQYCIDYGVNYEYIDRELERNTSVLPKEPEKEFTTEGTIGNGTFNVTEKAENAKDGWGSCVKAVQIYANGPLETTQMTCSNGTETNLAEFMEHYGLIYVKFMDGTTSVADGLFENFADISDRMYHIYFAPSVKTIGANAFRNCGAYNAYFSDGVNDIGEYAFADNTQLMRVTLSNTLAEIKEGTFYNTALISSGLRTGDYYDAEFKFVIPEGVQKIGKKAFSLSREHVWIADEPNGTETERDRRSYRAGYKTNRGGITYSAINVENGPVAFYIPTSVTEIYYDPEHPEDNAVAVTAEGYMDDWIKLRVHYGTEGYRYAKMFGLRYSIVCLNGEEDEPENEKNTPALYNIINPVAPEQFISGIISTDEWIEKETNSYMKWRYYPTSKMLTVNSTRYNDFNRYNFYYSDGTKVQQGDFEVDNLVMQGSFSAILGAELTTGTYPHTLKTTYYPTPISFFNPRHLDVSGVSISRLFDEAFKDCTRLESVTIQANNWESGKNIGENLFENTPALRSVVFADGVLTVPESMFKNHKGIQFVELPETITSIGANAFSGCTNLQKIEIPDSCVAIGLNAFKSCINVLSVTLGSGLNQIGKDAFSDLLYCENITVRTDKIRTDASVIGIDYREIFANLGTMTDGITVNYDNGLGAADFKVFDEKRVTKIVLGADIETLKNADCLTVLEGIELSTDNSNYYLENGALYTKKHVLALVPRTAEEFTIKQGCKGIGAGAFCSAAITSISVPKSVKTIGAYAFANAKNLKSVTLNKGTEEIGEGAFENCDRLRFIFTPTNLSSIGDCAFKSCDKLASVILNDELQSIGVSAFAECPSLRGIVIPEHTKTIGVCAFADCCALEYAYIWNAQPLGENVFLNDLLVRVYTVLGSDTYAWAREYGIPYVSYLDEDAFYTETMLRLDVEAGYLGYCEGEHGDIQWITVCEADCENEGYRIGVCEYCSELLAEVHIPATGHSYSLVTHVPSTATQCGADIYRCENCRDAYAVYDEEEPAQTATATQTVSGRVVLADNIIANSGTYPARGVAIQLEGVTLVRTDDDGYFTIELQRGTYNLNLHYAFGFDRVITVSVGNSEVSCGTVSVIGCDFNRDGAIDDEDNTLFRILMFARVGDDSYVDYADINHDGVINTTDLAILNACIGVNVNAYHYPEYIVK